MGARDIGLSLHHISPLATTARNNHPPCEPATSDGRQLFRQLVTKQQPHRQPRLEVGQGGSYAKLYAGQRLASTQRAWSRGVIVDFTRPARSRLLRLFGLLDRRMIHDRPIFVTLTYPAAWDADPRRWKRDLDVFHKRLTRVFPHFCTTWRLEFQSRGAPHFHLLVFGLRYLPHGIVARAWYDVVGSGDERHLAAGVEVKALRSWRGVMWYVSKYMGKVGAGVPVGGVGRFWGVYGRRWLPKNVLTVYLTFAAFFKLRRLLWRRAMAAKAVPWADDGRQGRRFKPRYKGEWKGVTTWGEWPTNRAILEATLFGGFLAPGAS